MNKINTRNDIFKTSRKRERCYPEVHIPKSVLEAYDTLEEYIKTEPYTTERMISQLQSYVITDILSDGPTGWVSSNRTTAPYWLKKHCKEFEMFPEILEHYMKYNWLDHRAYWRNKKTGEVILIAQPYRWLMNGMHLEEMQDLINTCKKLGIGCQISATSSHYPGKTLLMIFYELKNKKSGEVNENE